MRKFVTGLLIVLSVAALIAIRQGWFKTRPLPAASIPAVGTSLSASPASAPQPINSFWTESDGRVKSFLTCQPCESFEDKELTKPTNRRLPFFASYKILDPHRESGSYYLANKETVVEGWVSADSGVVITTRQGIDLHRFDKSEAAEAGGTAGEASFDLTVPIARTPEDLQAILEGLPNAPEALALLENPKKIASTFMKWPLLGSTEITVRGKQIRAHRVLMIGAESTGGLNSSPGTRSPLAEAGSEVTEQVLQEVSAVINRLDICVIMDHTISMTPWHTAFRNRIQQLVNELRAKYPNVDFRIGFGAYQDDVHGHERYIAKFLGNFDVNSTANQLDALLKAVNSESLLNTGSLDEPEAVYWGIVNSVTEFDWRDGARRVVLVCGDAPNHPETSSRNHKGHTEATVSLALSERSIVPFCVYSSTTGGTSLSQQLGRIADSVDKALNDSPVSREYPKGTQISLELSEAGFGSMIATMFEGRVAGVSDDAEKLNLLKSVPGVANRSLGQRIEKLDPSQVAMIVKVLRSRPADKMGPKFHAIIQALENGKIVEKKQTLAVYSGWIAETISETPVIETYEYLSKTELKLLQNFLLQIQEIKRDDAVELLTAGRFAAVFGEQGELTEWLNKKDVVEPLSRYMQQKHHIVTRTPLFQLSKDDFRAMTAQSRIEMLNLAEKYHDYLQQVLANSDYWRRIGEVDYVWLPSRHLP